MIKTPLLLILFLVHSQSVGAWDLLKLFNKSDSSLKKLNPKVCPPDQTQNAQPYQFNLRFDSRCDLPERRFIKDNFLSAVQNGLSCLENMNAPMASIHYQEIIESLSNPSQPFQVNCPELSAFPGSTGAYVRTGGIEGKFARNMSVNYYQKDVRYLKEKIFHELFHTIGHSHDDGFEYAYACSECCEKNDSNACQICIDDGNDPAKTARLLERWVRPNPNKSNTINRHLLSLSQSQFPDTKILASYLEFLKRNYSPIYYTLKIELAKLDGIEKSDLEKFELLSPEMYEREQNEYKENKKAAKKLAKVLMALQQNDIDTAKKEYRRISQKDLKSRSVQRFYEQFQYLNR